MLLSVKESWSEVVIWIWTLNFAQPQSVKHFVWPSAISVWIISVSGVSSVWIQNEIRKVQPMPNGNNWWKVGLLRWHLSQSLPHPLLWFDPGGTPGSVSGPNFILVLWIVLSWPTRPEFYSGWNAECEGVHPYAIKGHGGAAGLHV